MAETTEINAHDGVIPIPQEMLEREKAAQKTQADEKTLREKAEYLNLNQSAEGKKLIALVMEKLQDRIGVLIKEDAVASGLLSIITTMGHKQDQAEKAVATIYERQFKEPYQAPERGRFKRIF